MNSIAILGGGFSGTMVAVNLSRLSEHPLQIKLVNARRPLGRGTAYGTPRGEHLLNVVARNMSALPDHPDHFVDWLRSRSEYNHLSENELREMFVPRRTYGDYLRGLLGGCLHPIDNRCQTEIEPLEEEATDIVREDSGAFRIEFATGAALSADKIVLATGNQRPGSFPSTSPLRHDPRYRSDPWDEWLSRLPATGGTVVLLGTGLTMVDIVLTLSEIQWKGKIVAISRHGRLPKSHFRGIVYEDYLPENVESLGLAGLRSLVKQHGERLKQMSQNSAIAIDKLRPHTQRLWRKLSKQEKIEFLRDDAAAWNVTRHRIAASIHHRITDALDSGQLTVIAGTIEKMIPGEKHIDVQFSDECGSQLIQSADLVINCTGPQAQFSTAGEPLFDNLLDRGLVTSDELDMGICVDDNYAVIDQNGDVSDSIYAIGPLLKGSLWETTAVPELRGQAMRIAEHLLQREPAAVNEVNVIEYYI